MQYSNALVLALLFAASACSGAAAEHAAPTKPPTSARTRGAAAPLNPAPDRVQSAELDTPSSPPPRHAELHFPVVQGERFPYPLLRASVRGQPTWLIADTGATHHVLASWLARRLVIRTLPIDVDGRGHVGERVRVRGAKNPGMEIAEWGAFAADPLLVVDLPPEFEVLGLGGVASPQALGEGQPVIMDLEAGEIELSEGPSALASLIGRGNWLARCSDCICRGRPRSGVDPAAAPTNSAPVYVVPAVVGGVPARLSIDTGSATTDIRIRSRVGAKLAHRAKGRGEPVRTAGTSYEARPVPSVAVSIGDVNAEIPLDLVPGNENPDCPSDGSLGMDVLSRCALVMSDRTFAARCR